MTKKEHFIKDIEEALNKTLTLSPEGIEYFESLQNNKVSNEITENGLKILTYMQENVNTYNNFFKAKEIGEGLFMSPRSVSGSMRKLVSDLLVTKQAGDPVVYSLTDKGRNASF